MIQPTIIALTGYAGAGKDSIADILVDQGYHRMAFADPLKELAWAINPIVDLDADNLPVRLQDFVQSWTHEDLGIIGKVDLAKRQSAWGRVMLQSLGHEIRQQQPGYWLKIFEERYCDLVVDGITQVVVTDVRYHDEIEFLKSLTQTRFIGVTRSTVTPLNEHLSETQVTQLLTETEYNVVNDTTPSDAARDLLEFVSL